MTSKRATVTPPPAETTDADLGEIRADIVRTRAELGDSVEALAAKADVKTRARERVTAVKDRAAQGAQTAKAQAAVAARQVGTTVRRRPKPVAAGLAGIVAAVAAVVVLRRRRAANARVTRRRWLGR